MAIVGTGAAGGSGRGAGDVAVGGDHGKQLAGSGRRGPERGRPGLITDPEARN